MRSGKLGKWLCLLVIVEVLAFRNDHGCGGPEAGDPVQKKGALGSLQKKISGISFW